MRKQRRALTSPQIRSDGQGATGATFCSPLVAGGGEAELLRRRDTSVTSTVDGDGSEVRFFHTLVRTGNHHHFVVTHFGDGTLEREGGEGGGPAVCAHPHVSFLTVGSGEKPGAC